MSTENTSRTQNERADQSRARILEAAVGQFAHHGLAGARTEQIAAEAGVNKALLYYYFRSKDELYRAAVEWVAEGVRVQSQEILDRQASPGTRFLAMVLHHFDRIYAQRHFQSLMQQEMMRLHRGESTAMTPVLNRVFRPMMQRYMELLAEGMAQGELIDSDPMQIRYAALGANVFYFLSAPFARIVDDVEPLAPEVLAERRRASIRFLGQAIFVDRAQGVRVAEELLAATPMPNCDGLLKDFLLKDKDAAAKRGRKQGSSATHKEG
jgi:TetR/AcrR family transcriptional regulator